MFYAKQTTPLKNGYTESVVVALHSKKDREIFIAAKPSFAAITSKAKNTLCSDVKIKGNPFYEKPIGLRVSYIFISIDETKNKAEAEQQKGL